MMLGDFNARIRLQFKMFMTTEFRTVIIEFSGNYILYSPTCVVHLYITEVV